MTDPADFGEEFSAAEFVEPVAEAPAVEPAAEAPAVEPETVEITEAQIHAVLAKRVHDAEAKVADGRALETEAAALIRDGLKELDRAKASFHKYFPPTTQAQNTRDYLNASNAERAARVAAQRAPSQIDAARRSGNSRGWNPQAQSRGPGGVKSYTRKEALSLGRVVPGSEAALARQSGGLKA